MLTVDLPRRFVQITLGPRLCLVLLLSTGRLAFWRPGWAAWILAGGVRILRLGPLLAHWRVR